ncbi:sugar O-acetyltransferase [Parabacteroides distasonis]|uniref:sugar O-acetyltransferase n=1 Tax=Parabacteroides distasonis TaxID=823 RepID=UPI00352C292C
MTEYEKCMAGEPFDGSSPEITEMAVRTKRLLRQLRETDYADVEAKKSIYREMFGSIGEDVYIDIDFRCEYGKNIHFGNKVIVNMNCTFLDNNRINIGNNVMIAPDVKIFTATHSVNISERMPQRSDPNASICDTIAYPVTIEDGVWIGGNVTILPGISIGRNSVIGAGSVVTKDIPANSIAVGNPCRVIKTISEK